MASEFERETRTQQPPPPPPHLSSRGNGGTAATLTSVKKNLRKLVLRW